MSESVSLEATKFEDFLRCISILQDICNDADVRGGVLRQRTNDSSSIFQMDLSAIIGTIDMPLTSLKQKIDLFKCFVGQDVEISIEDDSFSFADSVSSLKFQTPNLEFMDNKFMTEEERDGLFVLDDSDLVLNTELSGNITKRMRVITQGFNVNSVQVLFDGETATIKTDTQARDQSAKFVSNIITDKSLEGSSNLVITPFVIDHDGGIVFKMYNTQDEVCVNKFDTSIKEVDISVYSRSTFSEE